MTLSRRSFLGSALAAPALLASPLGVSPARAGAPKALPLAQSFRVGEIEVTALSDGYLAMPTSMLAGFEAEEAKGAAKRAYQRFDPAEMRLGVNGYIVRTGDLTVAVDNGTPSVVAPTVGSWRDSLAQAGLTPEDVDIAFQTHLHMDHVGGLGELGQNARGLPNAQLVVSETEWDFTHSDAIYAQMPDMLKASMDMARALVAPYAADSNRLPMTRETEIAPGLAAVPLPGHTPGHMGLRISSGDESLLIWADTLHVPAYQFTYPEWTLVIDADLDQARRTRARMLDAAAADGIRVAGSHLDFPSLGYVERSGGSYRYVPSDADYG